MVKAGQPNKVVSSDDAGLCMPLSLSIYVYICLCVVHAFVLLVMFVRPCGGEVLHVMF